MASPVLYVSPDEAYAYFSGRGEGSWSSLPADQKLNALDRAGRMLDDLFCWKGEPVSPSQTLRWPRKNVFDAEGNPVSPETVPEAIKRGVCEQALYLIDPQREIRRKISRTGMKNVSLGSISMSVDPSSPEEIPLSPLAVNAVSGLGRLRGNAVGLNRSICTAGSLIRG